MGRRLSDVPEGSRSPIHFKRRQRRLLLAGAALGWVRRQGGGVRRHWCSRAARKGCASGPRQPDMTSSVMTHRAQGRCGASLAAARFHWGKQY